MFEWICAKSRNVENPLVNLHYRSSGNEALRAHSGHLCKFPNGCPEAAPHRKTHDAQMRWSCCDQPEAIAICLEGNPADPEPFAFGAPRPFAFGAPADFGDRPFGGPPRPFGGFQLPAAPGC